MPKAELEELAVPIACCAISIRAITLITLGKAEEGENINREKFLQAILTEFFIEYPILAVPDAITDPQSVVVTVLDNVILTRLIGYHNSVPNIYAPYSEFRLNFDRKGDTNTAPAAKNDTPTITANFRGLLRGVSLARPKVRSQGAAGSFLRDIWAGREQQLLVH